MSDVPDRLVAALADRYALERELGAGGMATVYLADDLKHDRKVAIKVLRPELAAVVGGERFISEIRTTANLQHPHILPLFDSGEADGFLWFAMPYVQGETLRDRLDREKELPIPEAVAITVKVAGALQAAHDRGIIHRDIKPANVLLANGEPLVADFGIALAVQEAGGGRLTETGLSVGTPYYMAPEQATADRDPDRRSDLYSLACMLYEMLAGDPPFTGSTAQAVLGQILTQPSPSVAAARPTVPPHVDAAILQALQKLPADRFESVAEFAKALGDESYMGPAARASGRHAALRASGAAWLRWVPWGVAAAAVLLAVAAFAGGGGGEPLADAPEPLRFALEDRIDWFGAARSLAISADGSVIAYQDLVDGRPAWVRRDLGRLGGTPLPGSEVSLYAAISPDGRWVAYDSGEDSVLYRIQPDASRPTVMAHPRNPPMGLTWLSNTEVLGGMLWFDGDYNGVQSTSIEDSTLVVRSDPGRGMHHEPYALPDGRHALVIDFQEDVGYSVLDTEDGTSKRLDLDGIQPLSWTGIAGVAGDVLVFRDQGRRLMAIRWDPDRLETVGSAVPVPGVDGPVHDAVMAHDGTLVMVLQAAGYRPVIVDPRGRVVRELPIDDIGSHFHPRVAPDPGLIYIEGGETQGHRDWLVDLRVDAARSFELGDRAYAFEERIGDWLSGDRFAALTSIQRNGPDPTLLVSRSARPEAVGESRVTPDTLPPVDHFTVAPGGRWAALTGEGGTGTARRVQLLSLETGERVPLVGLGGGSTYAPAISPDGASIAFVAESAGRPEVFMTSFPEEGEISRISEGRSGQPVWDPSGERIYYVTPTGLVAADLTSEPDGRVRVLDRRVLFDVPMFGNAGSEAATYDVHPDGFVLALEEGDRSGRVLVWKDWLHELDRLLAGG